MNFGPKANVNIEAELSDSSMLLTQLTFYLFHSDILFEKLFKIKLKLRIVYGVT